MRALSGPILFAGFLIALFALEALLLLFPHALVVNGHEGDLLHTMDAATRLSLGEWPHSGFMTPLGVLAFAPISLFMGFGFGPGTAFRLAMLLVAAVLLPFIWYVGETRVGSRLKYFFGAWLVLMTTGLVYGGDQATSSISMYYNRWAWSAVFLVGAIILLPRRDDTDREQLDGAILGLLLAALLLIKVTCFVAVVPAVALGLVLRRNWEKAISAAMAGLVVALCVTIAAGGPGYWLEYLRDVLFLAQDSSRTKPGLDFLAVVANPAYLPGTICLFMSVILLRMFARKDEGLVLLALAPGLFFITYQNWGNDPTWLFLLACLMLALRPPAGKSSLFSLDVRSWHHGLALASLVLISTSLLNVSYSTMRSAALDRALMVPVFQGTAVPDLLVSKERAYKVIGKIPMPAIRDENDEPVAPEEPVEFAGENLPDCSAQTGLIGMYHDIAFEMREAGLQNRPTIITDVVNPLWMFEAGRRIPQLAPWYYGGPSGIAEAEFVVVMLCPFKPDARESMLEELVKTGREYELVSRRPHYLLFKRARL